MPDGAKFCPACGTKAESFAIDDMGVPADSNPVPAAYVPDPDEFVPTPDSSDPFSDSPAPAPESFNPNPETYDPNPGGAAPNQGSYASGPESTPPWGGGPTGPAYQDPAPSANGDTMAVILKILAGVTGLILLFVGISQIFTALSWSFNYFRYSLAYSTFGQILVYLIFRLVHIITALSSMASGLLLLLHVLKFDRKYASSSMTAVTAACGLTAGLALFYYLFMLLIDSLVYQYGFYLQRTALWILIPCLIAIGGFFVIIQQMGIPPFRQGIPFGQSLSMSIEDIKAMASSINVSNPTGGQGPASYGGPAAPGTGSSATPDSGSYSSVNTGAEIPSGVPYGGGPGTRADGSPVPYQPPVYGRPTGPAGAPPTGPVMLTTDRSLVKYILLNLITCGIYSFFFIHGIVKDVNVACEGDGKNTAGLLTYVLLTVCTCGIYGLYWWYALGNRIAENGPRYGLHIQENGTTYLMWQIFGVLICGIGPFIATNFMCKNLNSICYAYNQANMGY